MALGMNKNLYIGLMSGTSMDAIDAVLVRLEGREIEALALHSHPYPERVRALLLKAISNRSRPDELGHLDRLIGNAFGDCAQELLLQSSTASHEIAAIGSHGQTVWHAPEGPEGFTLQLGDPNVIAERTGITTVADFRRRDIAAGGQGAPLTPAFHSWCFGSTEPRALLNLGGIANLTLLPPQSPHPKGEDQPPAIQGFDIGPANTLLDTWCQKHQQSLFDESGAWARSGSLSAELLESLLDDPYFKRKGPKSTGREYFNPAWLDSHLIQLPALGPADVQRTLVEFTARTVANAVREVPAADIYLCGGGYRNLFLVERLTQLIPDRAIRTTADLGLEPEVVEGAAFAWLARQTLAGLAGNVPTSTGARGPRVLGGIYPA